jgi:hypothetical protein
LREQDRKLDVALNNMSQDAGRDERPAACRRGDAAPIGAQGAVRVGLYRERADGASVRPEAVLLLAKPYRKSELARMLRQALETNQTLGGLTASSRQGAAGGSKRRE